VHFGVLRPTGRAAGDSDSKLNRGDQTIAHQLAEPCENLPRKRRQLGAPDVIVHRDAKMPIPKIGNARVICHAFANGLGPSGLHQLFRSETSVGKPILPK
jgi:hypothetical protein